MNGLHEVRPREFLPLGRELALGKNGDHTCDESDNDSHNERLDGWHEASGIMKQAILSENTAIRAAGSELTPTRCHRPTDRAALSAAARECLDSTDRHSAALSWRPPPAPEDHPATPAITSGSGTPCRSCVRRPWPLLPT